MFGNLQQKFMKGFIKLLLFFLFVNYIVIISLIKKKKGFNDSFISSREMNY